MITKVGDAPCKPWIYLIVATGDIYEDIPQAQAAAREGADVIAVIRSTGQSLLDFVPEGATREGFAGTYATQENFRLMRAALDETSRELGRYVRLTNYASGLCMPEIAGLAGLERLDMMLNDSMYGILFRDINPIRTFVDQRFSRQIHARAGHHHQHRRGQLPHHRRRRRGGAHGHHQPAAQRVLRQGGRARGLAARPRPRLRDRPRRAGLVPARARPRACWPATCSRTHR